MSGIAEAPGVPRSGDVGVGRLQHPGMAARQLIRGNDLVDQARGRLAAEGEHLAFEQVGRGAHQAEHAHEAGGAAGAGEDADEDLGQADAGLRVVGHEAAVAGEADLGADAAERPGAAQAIGLPPFRVFGSMPARSIFRQPCMAMMPSKRPRARSAPARAFISASVQVHAAGEIGLRAGDDGALDGGVGEDAVDGGVELGDAVLGQHVHRAAGQVPGDRRDAVGVDVGVKDRHLGSP